MAPRGGRDSAAWASRVASCVGRAHAGRGRAGRDRCARGLWRPGPGTPHAPARALTRPGPPGADLERKLQRRLAQWPLCGAPRLGPAGPAHSARAPAERWRPSTRWPQRCKAPCKAISRRVPLPPSPVIHDHSCCLQPSGGLAGLAPGPLHHRCLPSRVLFILMLTWLSACLGVTAQSRPFVLKQPPFLAQPWHFRHAGLSPHRHSVG